MYKCTGVPTSKSRKMKLLFEGKGSGRKGGVVAEEKREVRMGYRVGGMVDLDGRESRARGR